MWAQKIRMSVKPTKHSSSEQSFIAQKICYELRSKRFGLKLTVILTLNNEVAN